MQAFVRILVRFSEAHPQLGWSRVAKSMAGSTSSLRNALGVTFLGTPRTLASLMLDGLSRTYSIRAKGE